LATFAVLVALLMLLDTALREAAAALFAPPKPCAVPTLGLFRFRFETFVTSLFILARIVLPVLRATLVFDVGLLLPTRFRPPDEDTPLAVRFDVDFALDAGPVFFAFDLVVFFDLLRAAIVNLSTREHSRTHSQSTHEHSFQPHARTAALQNGKLVFCQRNHSRLRYRRPANSVRRLICRLAQIRRKIKEEDERGSLTVAALG
jgi:hypothetical protein